MPPKWGKSSLDPVAPSTSAWIRARAQGAIARCRPPCPAPHSHAGADRPSARVRHRFAWRYLVGFVHPASGRTVFHLATSVSIALFEVELAAFARQVGASPTKQIVLVLDRAGWKPTSVRLQVPEHVHLLFLPPYSPELQPAEHLWPLTNTCLINRHFATIEELEDAQFARCLALQQRPDLIRSTTRFHWWPQQICKRLGPRQR